jgi:putative zinc-dependent peptidase DUF5700
MVSSMRAAIVTSLLLAISTTASAQSVEVDLTACREMYAILESMHKGASREDVAARLDAQLATRPYAVMFQHYNRSWRPNHLPKDVFKGMILSLQFPDAYKAGENERADQMRVRWLKFYSDLELYRRQLDELERADISQLIREGVRYAQTWLPAGWTIPDFYLPIIPQGGSPAFTIGDAQGYDFFQLGPTPGQIDIQWLVGTIAHESHHLGMHLTVPDGNQLAAAVITLCIPEGMATAFVSGAPAGRAPAPKGIRFHTMSPDLVKAWSERVPEEEEMVRRQSEMLAKAVAGELTQDQLNSEMRDYWVNGQIGRAYVLGTDMLSAIDLAFGKKGVFEVLKDPRRFFEMYNAAIAKKPKALARCVPFPESAVKQALAIGTAK